MTAASSASSPTASEGVAPSTTPRWAPWRRPWPLDLRLASRVAAIGRRSREVLVLAAVTGVVVGLGVAGFEWLTAEVLLHHLLELPLAIQAAAPTAGLVVAALALRHLGGGASPATADEYIRTFHDPQRRLDLRAVPARLIAAVASLGSGGALGYEGPALYLGAAAGSGIQRRASRFFAPDDAKVLLVAGAAAGVSAIFKAPVTGLVFALEVPYQQDLARRMLLPAAIASAVSYVTFAALAGTEPLLPVSGDAPFSFVDLAGAAAIGITAGLFARLFLQVTGRAKRLAQRGHPLVRATVAGAGLAAVFLVGWALTGENLTLGPGYDALRWALDPDQGTLAILALATLRVAATGLTLGGGGVGGLFIPLVLQGALVGRAAEGLVNAGNTSLFPVLGIAAFLGAGYRVPLAAVVFVAEFTGRPGFVVPGLIAAVVSQLVMGRASASPYQVEARLGHLERRLRLPVATVLDADARTAPSDATLDELFWQHLVGTRQRSIPVVDGERFVGMVTADDLAGVDRRSWGTTTVGEVVRQGPAARLGWTVSQALRTMDDLDLDRLPVLDDDRYVGVVTAADVVKLDEILERSGAGAGGG